MNKSIFKTRLGPWDSHKQRIHNAYLGQMKEYLRLCQTSAEELHLKIGND